MFSLFKNVRMFNRFQDGKYLKDIENKNRMLEEYKSVVPFSLLKYKCSCVERDCHHSFRRAMYYIIILDRDGVPVSGLRNVSCVTCMASSLNEDVMCVFIDNKAWSDVVQDVHNDVYHRCLNMYRYVYGVTDFTVFSLYLCLDDNNEIIYTYRFSTTRAQLSVEFMNSGNYKDCVYLL